MGSAHNKKHIEFGQFHPPVQATDKLLSPAHCLWYGIPLGLHPLPSPLPSALMPLSRTPPLCLQEDTRGSITTGHHFHKLQDKFIETGNVMSTMSTLPSLVLLNLEKGTQCYSLNMQMVTDNRLPFSLSLYLHRPTGVSAWYMEPTMISCWEKKHSLDWMTIAS